VAAPEDVPPSLIPVLLKQQVQKIVDSCSMERKSISLNEILRRPGFR
jgi:hypothetical protein